MIKVMLEDGAYMPCKAHDTDAGFDLRTPVDLCIPPRGSAIIETGIHVEIPKGYVGMIKSKSGLNVRCGLQAEGVVDCGYTGGITVKMYNHNSKPYYFNRGDKLTQLVILELHPDNDMELVESLEDTERGASGFGSTGK